MTLDTALQLFHAAVRDGNAALDQIIEESGALSADRHKWKAMAASADSALTLVKMARESGIPCRLTKENGSVSVYGGRVDIRDAEASPQPVNGRFAYLDVETTGLDHNRHEVIELAIMLVAYDPDTFKIGEEIDRYCGFRQPDTPIPPDLTAIHGITNEMVAGCSLDIGKVLELISSADFIVAHNADFGRGFTESLMQVGKSWLCSCKGIDWRRYGMANRKPQYLLAAHGINPGNAHRAMDDVVAAVELLRCGDYFQDMAKPWVARMRALGEEEADA